MFQLRALSVMGSVLAATGLFGVGLQGQGQLTPTAKNRIDREPVVMFDVNGGTLLGPVFEHLAVYSDGSASYTSFSSLAAASVEGTTVSADDLNRLVQDLEAAGARTLLDQQMTVTDVPLTTVTLFRGSTDAQAHSFSYWIGADVYDTTDDVLSEFIATHFGAGAE